MPIRRAPRHRATKRRTDQWETQHPAHALTLKLRGSNRMRRFSRRFKERHPLCADPFGRHAAAGGVVPCHETHHIRSIETHPSLAFVDANCAPLCTNCHAEIERMERSGRSTAWMFRKPAQE